MKNTGTKHDTGKPPMELLPWEALEGAAQVLAHGRDKYSSHNWRGGFAWGRLAGACLRHVFAWLSGQDKDPESGLSHIDHATCCLMFLSSHIKGGLGTDDRYKAPPAPAQARPAKPYQVRSVVDDTLVGEFESRADAENAFCKSISYGYVYILGVSP